MDFERFNRINNERQNYGEMENPTVVSAYQNAGCGDEYRIFLRIDDHTEIVREASYLTTGCAFSNVALSLSADWVRGKTVGEAVTVEAADIESLFAFPERRKSYPETAAAAIRKALLAYLSRDSQNG